MYNTAYLSTKYINIQAKREQIALSAINNIIKHLPGNGVINGCSVFTAAIISRNLIYLAINANLCQELPEDCRRIGTKTVLERLFAFLNHDKR